MNKIFLLEDDVSLIDGLRYSLKKNDFDVKIARTVSEALPDTSDFVFAVQGIEPTLSALTQSNGLTYK